MINRRDALAGVLSCGAAGLVSSARASDRFPSRPIRIIVPYAAGTVTDLSARLLAQALAPVWGEPITVENVVAASGIVGTNMLAKAAPDGYTLAMVASNHVINPHLYRDLPFDPIRDFTPIVMVGRSHVVMVVNSRSDIHDVRDLIAKAKKAPGRLNYASAGNGSVGHLAMEQFKQQTGVYVTHIPYRGQNQAVTDLLAGQVDIALPALGVAQPFIRNGRMRAIGVVATKRSVLAPDIPTVQEQIGREVDAIAWWGLLGPKNMQPDVVSTINSGIVAQLQQRAIIDKMHALGAEIVAGTPKDMAETMQHDMALVGDIVKRAKLKLD